MWIARTIADCRTQRRQLTGTVALVPTMGALHAGHLWLIEAARKIADHVIVSIFVNPTQFGPHEDFDRYPRPIEKDLDACRDAGAAGVFNPSVDEMYPKAQIDCDVTIPALASILDGAVRPGHFAGVCRVVLKLFNITQPDSACFGMKDYQQLIVIQSMAADLNLPIEIVPCPTMRESDGLAMSSRNVYLNDEERKRATGLFKALSEARMLVEQAGEMDPRVVESAMERVLMAHQIKPDYAVVRHPRTLTPLDCIEPKLTRGVVALVAGRLGAVRLLDNMLLGV